MAIRRNLVLLSGRIVYQFLIGNVKQKLWKIVLKMSAMYQFLIGNVKQQ